MIPEGLHDLMSRKGILAAVVVSLESGEKAVLGNRASLESDYALRTLFDDLAVTEIEKYLEGQILPRIVQQGKVCGVICKPGGKAIVGLYYHDQRDVVQRYQFSKELDAEVCALW
jgi:hypothetical protein